MLTVIELLVIFLLPAGVLRLIRRFPVLKGIGAVALCYACGFVLSLLPIGYDKGLSQTVASVLVAIAIPLILFGFDLRSVRSLAKSMVTGYCLQIVTAVAVAACAALIARKLATAPQLAGMAVGLYTGGTPNLIAIGNALLDRANAAAVILAANTADFVVGGVYFLLIVTVIRPVYRRFLGGGFGGAETSAAAPSGAPAEYDFASIPRDRKSLLRLAGVCGLAVLCLAVGAGLELLVNGSLDGSLYIMITVSVLGIAVSFLRPVREVPGSYQCGQYLVLVFSLGLSMSIDLAALAREILPTLAFFACVQTAAVIVHLLLCKAFRLDGGTALITSTAGLYGPPFIAPVAEAWGDRRLIAPGVICGIVGLVIGNLLGIGVGWTLGALL